MKEVAAHHNRRAISTPKAPHPAGTYSQAICAGGSLYTAGQTPRLPDGTRLNDEPFEVQARQTLRNLDAILAAAGTSLAGASFCTVYLADPEQRGLFDEIWAEFVSDGPPSRAVVQSDLPGFAIEVTAVAACACVTASC